MKVQSSKFKVLRRCSKLITNHLTLLTFLLLVSGFLLLFRSPSPAYAACNPPCNEYWTPIYGWCSTPWRCSAPVADGICRRGTSGYGWCGAVCCKNENCTSTTYRCVVGWKYECICPSPSGCSEGCPAGYECINEACVPTEGNGPDPGCPASCGSKSDCDPCGSGYDCIGGSCQPQCSQAGSGDKCDPDQPNNGCPAGESCCWGAGECYLFCCGGGGHTPRNPKGKMTLSPQINDPDSSQYFFTKTGLEYKDYFYRRGYDPGLANQGKATVCVRAGDIAETPEAYSCDFGRGMAAGAHQWYNPNAGCVWKNNNFSPGGAQYNKYGGGNFIMLRPARDDCKPGEDDYPCKISVRFRAPPNQILRAVEFDYDNNVPSAFFGFARYSYGHFRGDCPQYTEVPKGKIPKGTGHKIIHMPATKDAWLVLDATGWNQPYWAYRAIIYNIKLHFVKVDKTAKADVDVVSNVVEPSVAGEFSHMDRVRFSNDSVNWSGWVYLDKLSSEGRWVYPWTLGNPTKTVWMHACNIHDLCTVFSDSINYNPYGTVSGYIWNDLNNNDGTGKDPSTEPNYTASTVTVSYSCPSKSRSKETSDGSYTFSNVPAGESCSISISGLDSPWTITPACRQTGDCTSPQTFIVAAGETKTINFGVWQNPLAWFQGVNGDAYGLGVNVRVPGLIDGNCYVKSGYGCWFLAADPATSGGVVISGNATLSCSGRCSERGSLRGWNARDQAIDWPASLKFSPPSDAINISTVFSSGAAPQFTLQKGKSYIWDLEDDYYDKIYQTPKEQGYHLTGSGHRVAVIYVSANRTPFIIHPRFRAYKADGTPGGSNRQGVIFVVDGDVRINRNPVGQPLDDDTPNLEAMVIAKGTVAVFGTRDDRRRIVKGMLYGKNGISVTGTELEDNLYPRLLTIYNALYYHPSNPLRQNAIKWREITPP